MLVEEFFLERHGVRAGHGLALPSAQVDWNDTFLSAALEPEKWPSALDELARRTGATHGQLIGVGRTRDIPFNFVTNIEPSVLQEFIDIGGASASLNFRIAASNQDAKLGNYDSVLFEKHYDAALPHLESDIYVHWCDENDIPFGCQTNLLVDSAGLVGLATLRNRKDGRTTPAQRTIFAEAAAAARRAVRLQERLEGEQARLLAGAFDTVTAAAFILDARGRVQAMTASAEEIVRRGGIALRKQFLHADAIPFSLSQAAESLTADNGVDHVRLRIDRPNGGPPLFVEGFRLPKRSWSLGHLPRAILITKKPHQDRAGIARFLSALYRMTMAEADIAIGLFEGKSRTDICAERAVTAETLRGQVKSICAKTRSQNEADLMRLLGAIMA